MNNGTENIFSAGEQEESAIDMATEQDRQRRINFGLTFSTREGFEVVKDLLAFCHNNAISYVRGDQYETAFRDGERNVFLYILSNLSDEMKQRLSIGG